MYHSFYKFYICVSVHCPVGNAGFPDFMTVKFLFQTLVFLFQTINKLFFCASKTPFFVLFLVMEVYTDARLPIVHSMVCHDICLWWFCNYVCICVHIYTYSFI